MGQDVNKENEIIGEIKGEISLLRAEDAGDIHFLTEEEFTDEDKKLLDYIFGREKSDE